jgi:hypothetical protein
VNPLANPFVSEMHNYRDGRDYTSVYGLKVYQKDSAEPVPQQLLIDALAKAQDSGLRDRTA